MKTKSDELPAFVLQSRDMHDAMIAARVALQQSSDANASQNMASLETQLAEQLLAIAANRKSQLNLQSEIAKLKGDRPLLESEMVEAQKLLAAATQLVAPAQAKLAEATSAHQSLASQMSEQEKKAQALAAAIE
jgi:chromosome segregation ATPase